MNLRFSGIPEIQAALRNGLAHAQSIERFRIIAEEEKHRPASNTFKSAIYRWGEEDGRMTTWIQVAAQDLKFPEFLDQFEQHLDTPIDKHPQVHIASSLKIAASCGYNIGVLRSEHITQGFYGFANGLVSELRKTTPNWQKLEQLLNKLRPSQMGELKVDTQTPEFPVLLERQSDGKWATPARYLP